MLDRLIVESILPWLYHAKVIEFFIERGLEPLLVFIVFVATNLLASFILMLVLKRIDKLPELAFLRDIRKRCYPYQERYGAFLLFFFTIIPLPWTNSIIAAFLAFIFGIHIKKAFASIALAVFIFAAFFILVSVEII